MAPLFLLWNFVIFNFIRDGLKNKEVQETERTILCCGVTFSACNSRRQLSCAMPSAKCWPYRYRWPPPGTATSVRSVCVSSKNRTCATTNTSPPSWPPTPPTRCSPPVSVAAFYGPFIAYFDLFWPDFNVSVARTTIMEARRNDDGSLKADNHIGWFYLPNSVVVRFCLLSLTFFQHESNIITSQS